MADAKVTLTRIDELTRDAWSDAPDMDDVSIDRAEFLAVLGMARRALVTDAELAERRAKFQQCTGMSAKECPRCGKCTCDYEDFGNPWDLPDAGGCPLHDTKSDHAAPPMEDFITRSGARTEGGGK